MKFKPGQNKFRILSAPVIGYEYWGEDNKPHRSPEMWNYIPNDARLPWDQKHFWAMVVWNYAEEALQILQITQKSILVEIENLALNEDWGDPREYNIVVTRKGKGLKTEYSVQPSPKTKLPEEVRRAYEDKNVNLEALFEGKSPFDTAEHNDEFDAETFTPQRPKFMKQKEAEVEVDENEPPFP